jgi:histidinol phosphatase-like PHP family hydrolase
MIDFHTHTFYSDGELVPSELVRRAEAIGYNAIAITDHVDTSNYDFVVERIVAVAKDINKVSDIKVIPGAEITHVPPPLIKDLADDIRRIGAKIIIVHGETITEPVANGTNLSAVQADIDILAHPGLVDEETCKVAKERDVYFEITSRKGHSLTNSHVASMAIKHGVKMVLNSDSHQSSDLLTKEFARKTLLGASISIDMVGEIFNNSKEIVNKLF